MTVTDASRFCDKVLNMPLFLPVVPMGLHCTMGNNLPLHKTYRGDVMVKGGNDERDLSGEQDAQDQAHQGFCSCSAMEVQSRKSVSI
mmetsp:Transcript_90445/g.165991  ORF Transcript_90445/g.165991 Transcript_90445/m.165991 type:complete len:87 (-) Transcript_90445:34-294(-)